MRLLRQYFKSWRTGKPIEPEPDGQVRVSYSLLVNNSLLVGSCSASDGRVCWMGLRVPCSVFGA